MKNIFLIGFMGTGKSTVAKKIHVACGMEVIEMDGLIAEREGMSITKIFETHGEEYFRNLETNLLIEVQKQDDKVVSCGGGVVLRKQNVSEMKKNGVVVLLTAKPETILKRVKGNNERPILKGNINVAFITELLEQRREKYEEAADLVIATDGKATTTICKEIIERVNEMER